MSTPTGARQARPGLAPVVLLVLVAAVAAAVVATQLLVGGVPVLQSVLPSRAGEELELRRTAAPLLDCNGAETFGDVVDDATPVPADGLRTAAGAQRSAARDPDLLVTLTGYRAGDGAVAVWSDAVTRARLVLSFRPSGDGWVLVARSGCA